MTKKDYVRLIADLGATLAATQDTDAPPRAVLATFAAHFAGTETKENPRFDPNRFTAALDQAFDLVQAARR